MAMSTEKKKCSQAAEAAQGRQGDADSATHGRLHHEKRCRLAANAQALIDSESPSGDPRGMNTSWRRSSSGSGRTTPRRRGSSLGSYYDTLLKKERLGLRPRRDAPRTSSSRDASTPPGGDRQAVGSRQQGFAGRRGLWHDSVDVLRGSVTRATRSWGRFYLDCNPL